MMYLECDADLTLVKALGIAPRDIMLSLRDEHHGIRIFHDAMRGNTVILLCPRLEEWLIQTAKEAGVSLEQFHLSADADILHELLTIRPSSFMRFLDDVRTHDRMRSLEQALKGRMPDS